MLNIKPQKSLKFWALQGPGWCLLIYLIYAQAIPAFNYELGVRMGTQESRENITDVGVAFWYGFALGDLLIYIPLLGIGLVANCIGRSWSRVILAAAMGITVYWPIVCLAAIYAARDANGWLLPNERNFWIVLPLIAAWGGLGLWLLGAEQNNAER